MMSANKKAFDSKGDYTLEMSTENKSLKNRIGSYDEKWLEEAKRKLLKEFDDEKRAILIIVRREKRMKKQKQRLQKQSLANFRINEWHI